MGWIGYQTLGRAQLGVGEVGRALRNFKVAFHLNPEDKELWTEDILWARHLEHQARLPQVLKEEGDQLVKERIKPQSILLPSPLDDEQQ